MSNHSLTSLWLLLLGCTAAREPGLQAGAPAPYKSGKLAEAAAVGKAAADFPMSAPPATRVEEVRETLHGVTVEDPFRWLEDVKAPEVQMWMDAQDAYARRHLQALPLRSALAKRLEELLYLDAVGVPLKRGGRYFYLRTHADKEKGILYWRERAGAPEKVLLDPNGWSKDGTVSLGSWVPSWDGRKVVFQRKPNAADEATLHVVDVDSGEWSKVDVIEGGKYASPSWTPDNRAFYYEYLPTDPAIPVDQRPGYTEIRLHRLGSAPSGDEVVHPRLGDPKMFLSGALSVDGKTLVFVHTRGWSENDVFVQRLGKDKAPVPLARGIGKNASYGVTVWKDQLYIGTTEGAPNGRLFKASLSRFDRAAWKELVPEQKDAKLEDFGIVGGQLALSYLREVASELHLHGLDGKRRRTVELPGLGTASGIVGLPDDDEGFFRFSSFVFPPTVVRVSARSGEASQWAKTEVPVDPSPYMVDRVHYPSKDGTRISMFLVRRKDPRPDGETPVMLYGYGGFNISLTSGFSGSVYPWLEAGGIYAVAHLRGGGEYGEAWHEAGKGARKQNVFDDFIAAAEYLVRTGWTRPGKLAIHGRSNGGLLVGAAMTQRPELFGAVLCGVPLLDMVRYHKFGSGQTWIAEYGSAEDPSELRALHAYSPYHRVAKGTKYPPMLMLSSDHDDRVDPMHARKFVAAVQALAGTPAYLRVERNAGHAGADQVRRTVEQYADLYAFTFHALGAAPRPLASGPADCP